LPAGIVPSRLHVFARAVNPPIVLITAQVSQDSPARLCAAETLPFRTLSIMRYVPRAAGLLTAFPACGIPGVLLAMLSVAASYSPCFRGAAAPGGSRVAGSSRTCPIGFVLRDYSSPGSAAAPVRFQVWPACTALRPPTRQGIGFGIFRGQLRALGGGPGLGLAGAGQFPA
jgi:hypothetical protein